MELVDLVFRANIAQLERAEKKLDDVGKSANEAQGKAKGLSTAFDGLGRAGGPVGDIANKVTDLSGTVGEAVGVLGKLGGAATIIGSAAAAAAVGIVGLTLAVADQADEMNDLANRTNVSTERLSLYDQIAKMAGSSVEELVGSAEKLGAKLAKQDEETGRAVTALRELGVSTKDANGETKSMLDLQEEIVLAVDKATDSSKAEGLAIQLLGNDYYKLRTAVRETAESKSEMYDLMTRTGSVVTTKLAKGSDELNDSISKLGLVSKGFGNTVAELTVGPLTNLFNKLTDIGAAAVEAMRKIAGLSKASVYTTDDIADLETRKGRLNNKLAAIDKSAIDGPIAAGIRKQIADIEGQIADNRTRLFRQMEAEAAEKFRTLDGAPGEGNRPDGKTTKPKVTAAKPRVLSAADIYKMQQEDQEEFYKGVQQLDELQAKNAADETKRKEKAQAATDKYNLALAQQADRYKALIDPNHVITQQLEEINRLEGEGALLTSEATKARAVLKAQIIDDQATFSDGWSGAFAKYQQNAYTASQAGADAFASATSLMEQGITQFALTGKFSFKDFARSAIAAIAQIYAKLVATKLIGMFVGAFSGAGAATGEISGPGLVFKSANGSAFENGIQKFASGGVVNRATNFGMAGGRTGVMGEAGPEGILPLKRGANGALGVQVMGGSMGAANQSTYNIYVTVPAGKDAKETADLTASAMKKQIEQISRQTIANEKRVGGLLAA